MSKSQDIKDEENSREENEYLPGEVDYDPQEDWINQRELAEILGITPETASRWASDGKLRVFEHGMIAAGKRKYSRQLVRDYQRMKIRQARKRMMQAIEEGSGP